MTRIYHFQYIFQVQCREAVKGPACPAFRLAGMTPAAGFLRQRNEEETATAAIRDMKEKQALIDLQMDERRQLQHEIRNARRLHTLEVTGLHHEISLRKHPVRELGISPRSKRRIDRQLQP